jgi:SAM-dependent methyltransferase
MMAVVVNNMREDQERLSEIINRLPGPLAILEAGCGRHWGLKLSVPYVLTGIDTDPEALRVRVEKKKDLDIPILGDLRTIDLPPRSYDVIYCSWVLEHISGAVQVLENFERWLKPGGLLIVRVPDRDSMFGIVTRFTPFWFHIWYYRWINGVKSAGQPGHSPYPTHYDAVISRHGFEQFCKDHHLSLLETHRIDNFLKRSTPRKLLGAAVGLFSLGSVPWRWNNLTYVAQKR